MSKDKKSSKMRNLIGNLLGIKEWKLKADGHLDVKEEELSRMKEVYGEDFVQKLEKLLSEEEAAGGQEAVTVNKADTKQAKSDMLKLELLCALLGIQAITMSEDGKATLSKEQLESIEAGLKKLQDEKTAAESNLTAANTAKDNAVNALSSATKAMDELDATVKAAADPAAKVEAIRKKLAEKPGAAATGAQGSSDNTRKKIEGADQVTDYARGIV